MRKGSATNNYRYGDRLFEQIERVLKPDRSRRSLVINTLSIYLFCGDFIIQIFIGGFIEMCC